MGRAEKQFGIDIDSSMSLVSCGSPSERRVSTCLHRRSQVFVHQNVVDALAASDVGVERMGVCVVACGHDCPSSGCGRGSLWLLTVVCWRGWALHVVVEGLGVWFCWSLSSGHFLQCCIVGAV